MRELTLRDAIKILLECVNGIEDGRHAAEGSFLTPRQKEAVDMLTRHTSGWVPTDRMVEHEKETA